MNHKPNQLNASEKEKTLRPSLSTGTEQSDTKEILFLAAGLITLTLGLGGVFMYTDDAPQPTTASNKAAEEVSSYEMAKAFATPPPSVPSEVPESGAPIPQEPSLHLVANDPVVQHPEATDVYFDLDRWALSDGAKSLLKTQVTSQGDDWTGALQVDGHTDSQGSDSYNQALGLRRAESVKAYLMSLGIDEDRIQVTSLGKDGAVCEEKTPDCFEHNRRAHVVFVAQPSAGQETALLSPTPNAQKEGNSEDSSAMMDTPSLDTSGDETVLQDEIPVELVAADPVVSSDSLP